jgi:hypothetical protein
MVPIHYSLLDREGNPCGKGQSRLSLTATGP